jgi:hypothetical protein
MMKMEQTIKLGKYQHFKGKFCEVIGIAKNSENPADEFVVYKELSEEFPNGQLWIRPKKMFLETVNRDGKEIPRFKFIE